ncbi:transporter substrate-binding domain-containing protein [Schnuerera ultunensis]|uniref:Extracellular solute-binding protein family 3 n=1 Tax=[Clostridium] ultunense Esp TaxID=1288971 RepID=A0A1M4PN15_9FIRM|nr:transporter substrate-binding domain-containing protein [Schnuerera ultunensis]SHD76862.1 Extracellular solute-binding protein family 3 [[Clostridium] ultunense Esp]
MKKQISLFMIIILVLSSLLVACGKDNEANFKDNNSEIESYTLEGIKNKGKLIMGTSADYPPFEFHKMIDGEDTIVGFDIEIAKHIADELGVELEIKDMEFDKLLGGLSTGMLDMVIAGMNPDPEREANFTDIYYEANLSVLVNKEDESKITTLEDLEGKSIGVQIGTTQEEIAQEKIKDADVKSLSTNPDIVMNLKTKKIDCALMEAPVAESFAKVNEDIVVVEGLNIDTDANGVAIAVKKGNDELTEKLNEILAEAKSKGLLDKWLVEADELNNEN